MNELIISTEIIGYVATFFTSVSWVPQLKKTWTTGVVEGLSKWYFLMLIVGFIFWVWYGVRYDQVPLIMTNIFAISACTYMVYAIYKTSK
jgi:MtN3 and saliva related transmembrane protein